jgi:hypothetical protein
MRLSPSFARASLLLILIQLTGLLVAGDLRAAEPKQLAISWEKNYLTIRGDFPGEEVSILYLEAYCRPGSTDREWGETVIKHTAELVSQSDDGRVIKLKDTLADGLIVEHTITAGVDSVSFELVAHNPTDSKHSERTLGAAVHARRSFYRRSQRRRASALPGVH